MTREEKIQEILNVIRFNLPEIKNILEKGSELFEEDNGSHPFKEKEEWSEEYIAQNIVWLRKKFSRKRLEHLIEVRNYVRGEIKEVKREPVREIKREINNKKDLVKGKRQKIENEPIMIKIIEVPIKATIKMVNCGKTLLGLGENPMKKAKIRKEKEKYDKKF